MKSFLIRSPQRWLPVHALTAPEAANPISRICAVYLLAQLPLPRAAKIIPHIFRIMVGAACRPSAEALDDGSLVLPLDTAR